jgi:hypothetical protein
VKLDLGEPLDLISWSSPYRVYVAVTRTQLGTYAILLRRVLYLDQFWDDIMEGRRTSAL